MTKQARGIGSAHGKIILMGEHSVVYGHPALALPFQAVEMTAEITPMPSRSVIRSALYEGPLQVTPPHLNNISALVNKIRQDLGMANRHICLTISSSIPAERGMGSSAAVAVAVIKAFYAFIDQPLSLADLIAYADYAEAIAHGQASGLDARLAAYNLPLIYRKGQPVTDLHFESPYWLVVADTGIPGNTKQAVAGIAKSLQSRHPNRKRASQDLIQGLAQASQAFIDCLDQGATGRYQDLCDLMNQAQANLQALQVSSQELDYGIQLARQAGAGGAKLTGGGRGGCFIALCQTEAQAQQVSQALLDQELAVASWLTPFSA
ncbi:hypothetical protein AWM75_07520 [Aerococcus urinaehominis]|uniref:Uncharacterized protein n=1 Tax=Aerococcus urinaehominis TaxID=128944 RepID=A0A0X8FM88_9LACT|nr:mevalonate kinase [Aerococcus urinaehominis]AMB99822.1 hypothetical protein AWM75_07520 [Aerococcus urinaehominis]SDM55303.1 mevalonate kinase [Aerococcus urinaehominis]